MKTRWMYVCVLLLISDLNCHASFPLGGTAIALVGATLYGGFEVLRCTFYECCHSKGGWIKPNITALKVALDKNLHGQHLVQVVVPRALRAHLNNAEPNKALVMSFHGWTGGGKNYVSKFIAESMYKLGKRSQYVHTFVSTVDFPHEQKADIYKLHLQDWIRGNVSKCERSLFIFDEIDKMPQGMVNGIKPFIDYHESISDVDFRKSVFIFLSNTGGPEITMEMLKMWRKGKLREEVTLMDLEHLIQHGAFNEDGGLHRSELIEHSLVDYYVPFLPLERHHVKLCVEDEIRIRGHVPRKDLIESVLNEMKYFPQGNKLFSTTGCKRVAQKVGYLLADMDYEKLFA